ncbi:MAG TPA: c-type cytochrome, partial [Humisphaera sp.]
AAERAHAARSLRADPSPAARDVLSKLLGGTEPAEVQLAAVAALDAHSEPEVAAVLTAALPKLTPAVRPAAVQALVARPARAAAFLSAIDAGKLPATLLDPAALARLRQSKDAEVRRLAEAVAAKAKVSPRAEAVAAYRKSLDLAGDAARGHALFAQRCAACHKLDGEGNEVGPNLAAMRSRGTEAVLVNLIDPNREVNGQYVEYQLETKDGRTASGLLSAESAAAVTLLKPGGAAETIARADIATLRSTGQSIMPEGLERDLDAQAVADLIAFVMKER